METVRQSPVLRASRTRVPPQRRPFFAREARSRPTRLQCRPESPNRARTVTGFTQQSPTTQLWALELGNGQCSACLPAVRVVTFQARGPGPGCRDSFEHSRDPICSPVPCDQPDAILSGTKGRCQLHRPARCFVHEATGCSLATHPEGRARAGGALLWPTEQKLDSSDRRTSSPFPVPWGQGRSSRSVIRFPHLLGVS
jgi:hypothetical protein